MLKRAIGLIESGMAEGLHVGAQVCVWQQGECVADVGVGVVDVANDGPSPACECGAEGGEGAGGAGGAGEPGPARRSGPAWGSNGEDQDESGAGPALTCGAGAKGGGEVSRDSIALWMSSGKPITAIAVAQLVEQGEVELDDPVAAFLPAFAAHGKEDITVRHLLTHTAGLRTADFRYPRDDWDTIIAAVCDRPPEHGWVTGERAGYHTQTTWFVLGELVRLVDGRAIDRYVREMLFEPLNMNDSWMGMPPEVYDSYAHAGRLMMMPNTATTAAGSKPSKSAVMSKDWSTRPRPGGNCMGPIRELATFYRMLLNGGELEGVRIVQRETVAQFTTRQRIGMFDQTFKATVDWGLGFVVNSLEHAPLVAGGGDGPALTCGAGAGKRDLSKIPYSYGPNASRATFGHSGAQSSVGFADPGNDLVVALVFNGMPGEAKHQRRVNGVLTALYADLGL